MAIDQDTAPVSPPTAAADQPIVAVQPWVKPDFSQVNTAPEVTDYSFRMP
jgi:hypothetical protein